MSNDIKCEVEDCSEISTVEYWLKNHGYLCDNHYNKYSNNGSSWDWEFVFKNEKVAQ